MKTNENAARFKVNDKVRVRDLPYMFYTRTQMFTRGVVGTIASLTYMDQIPEEEAFNVDGKSNNSILCDFARRIFGQIPVQQRHIANRVP